MAGGGDGRAMLVATVTLGGVASEASKELAEWGDRQIRGNENEGDCREGRESTLARQRNGAIGILTDEGDARK